MGVWRDLFTSGVGLMVFLGTFFMVGMGIFFFFFFQKKMAEGAEAERQRKNDD